MPSGRRIRLAVLFGGRSAEHEVSLRSARAVLEHLAPARYEVRLIGITRDGGWLGAADSEALLAGKRPAGRGGRPFLPDGTDCVFPVLHGPFGEDGTLQGWTELCGIPCVGSPCLGSALAMDKGATKRVVRDAGVPVLPWAEADRDQYAAAPSACLDGLVRAVGLPCFVKPVALGSSVGVGRAEDRGSLDGALAEAFRYDRRVLVEPEFPGREIEVAVLEDPTADGGLRISPPGEIRPRGWYDYRAKYEDRSADLLAPAPDLPAGVAEDLARHCRTAFAVLRLAGLARIDFFLGAGGRLVLNEVNTLPGFTSISMYPRLMALAGIPFAELCDRLVDLALARAGSEGELQAEHRPA
ncbi:MAG: D-alanine--D-alanine ligase [Planctomycetota bacterium]|nr:MAG: D-alanine--D-alanine ligase [Planctomycetota bacterium]